LQGGDYSSGGVEVNGLCKEFAETWPRLRLAWLPDMGSALALRREIR
jgi:hypothetical protein